MDGSRLLEIMWSSITDQQNPLSSAETGILLLLLFDIDATARGSTLSIGEMTARLGYKRANSVRSALAKLTSRGLISCDVAQGRVGTYQLTDPQLKLNRKPRFGQRKLKLKKRIQPKL